jgi:hypothetical protein
MTYNTIAYIIYGFVTVYVTLIVGNRFHKNGIHYLLLFQSEEHIAHAVNNILLVLYYCLNIGYAIAIIYLWEPILSLDQLISSSATHIGTIVLSLGLMHYFNMTWIYLYFRKTKLQITN